MSYKYWTNHEVKYLQQNYGFKPIEEVAADLNRTVDAVINKASRLGIKSRRPHLHGSDTEVIKQLIYEGYRASQIAEKIGISKRSVNLRLQTDAFDKWDRAAIRKNGREWWKDKVS